MLADCDADGGSSAGAQRRHGVVGDREPGGGLAAKFDRRTERYLVAHFSVLLFCGVSFACLVEIETALVCVVGPQMRDALRIQDARTRSRTHQFLPAALNNIATVIGAAMSVIKKVITVALGVILAVWNAVWPGLKTVVMGIWTVFGAMWSAIVGAVTGRPGGAAILLGQAKSI